MVAKLCRTASVAGVQPTDPDFIPALGRSVRDDGVYLKYNMAFDHGVLPENLPRTPRKLFNIRQSHKPFEANWLYARGYQDSNHASMVLWAQEPETTSTGVHGDWTIAHNVAFSTDEQVTDSGTLLLPAP